LLSILFFILLGRVMTNVALSAESEKIYFGVDIDLHNVAVDIRVNDIPVYFDHTSGQMKVEMPASLFIVNGKNELEINGKLPIRETGYAEGAYVQATLFKETQGSEGQQKHNLLMIKLEIFGDEVISTVRDFTVTDESIEKSKLSEDKSISASAISTFTSPFPRWNWQDGKDIESTESNYLSLVERYRLVHQALKTKNMVDLKALYRKRAIDTAIAYGLNGEDEGYDKLSLGVDMHDSSLELRDLFLNKMELDVIANGKLARIQNVLAGQPILFWEPNTRALHLHKFMFYKNANDEWVMIR